MVETDRLIIIPLDCRQLRLYMQNSRKLDKELRISHTVRITPPRIRDRTEYLIIPEMKKADKDNYLYYTFWIVVEKSSRNVVAELGFKGGPNENGEVEIGYGTFFGYRRKGIMTEAVGGIIRWARNRSDVNCILAETDEENNASIKVLQKNHFENFCRKEKMLWWKKAVI
ncbi:MAG TPA: GNAT family N-acetyltransferase [Puia sp.]|nr:GNAT family N-acetyltransferase [Puia sp.]